MVYEFLNDIFSEFGNYTLVTGWYDPYENAKSGEQDDYTGFHYVRLEYHGRWMSVVFLFYHSFILYLASL